MSTRINSNNNNNNTKINKATVRQQETAKEFNVIRCCSWHECKTKQQQKTTIPHVLATMCETQEQTFDVQTNRRHKFLDFQTVSSIFREFLDLIEFNTACA